MPLVYGGIAGVLFQLLSIPLSDPIMEAVSVAADAVIPTIMLTLGMQLANISLKRIASRRLSAALILKLAVSPVLAYFIASLLPVNLLENKSCSYWLQCRQRQIQRCLRFNMIQSLNSFPAPH